MSETTNMLEQLQERIDWYEAEIARLKQVCAEQDRRASTTTARLEVVSHKGPTTFIVTCPAGDEAKLMRTMFAGLAAMSWTGFCMAAEELGLPDIREASRVLFGNQHGEDEAAP